MSGVRSWCGVLTQGRRVRREILELERGRFDGRVERVDRVEIFIQASRPYSSIMDSIYSLALLPVASKL